VNLKKGEKAELANGTHIVILGEYSAHDGQAYKARMDEGNDTRTLKLSAYESCFVRRRIESETA
jgi:hypothetical protein